MGAKKGAKSKKKNGPKGKKARAKAKLDQVWGEHVDQDARQASKVRKGKSRLGLSTTTTTSAAAAKNKSSAALTSSSNAAAVSSTAIKSVLSNDKKRGHNSTGDSDGTSSDDDDSDDETMGGMNGVGGNGGSLANLLNRIRHRPESGATFGTKMSAVFDSEDEEDSDDSEDGEDESSHSSSSSESKNDDQDMEDIDESEDDKSIEKLVTNGADKDSPNNIKNATTTTASEDPYEAHFSKPPLPQLDSLPTIATSTTSSTQQQLVPHTGNNRKVNTSSLLNSSMDIQMSGPLLDSWDECMNKHGGSSNSADGASSASSAKHKKKQSKSSTSEVGKQVKKTWEEFAHGPYQHMRQVLTRNWKSVNKGALKRNSKRGSMADDTGVDVDEGDENGKLFSSLQLSLYPAIARYADVMISAETRQVSK